MANSRFDSINDLYWYYNGRALSQDEYNKYFDNSQSISEIENYMKGHAELPSHKFGTIKSPEETAKTEADTAKAKADFEAQRQAMLGQAQTGEEDLLKQIEEYGKAQTSALGDVSSAEQQSYDWYGKQLGQQEKASEQDLLSTMAQRGILSSGETGTQQRKLEEAMLNQLGGYGTQLSLAQTQRKYQLNDALNQQKLSAQQGLTSRQQQIGDLGYQTNWQDYLNQTKRQWENEDWQRQQALAEYLASRQVQASQPTLGQSMISGAGALAPLATIPAIGWGAPVIGAGLGALNYITGQ
jgi:hypothetical protein